MPAAFLHAPAIPGVTQQHAFQRRLPSILEALKSKPMSDERAKKLEAIKKEWFDSWRWAYDEQRECVAMELGAHWGYLDKVSGLWVSNTLDEDPDRVRVTVNELKSIMDTATAKGTQDAPIFKTAAGQPGVAAAAANETARAFLEQTWRFHALDDLYRDTFRGAFGAGTDFILLEWDKTAGREAPMLRRDGSPVMEEIPQEPLADATIPEGVAEDGSLVPPAQDAAAPIDAPPFAGSPQLRPKIGPEGDLRYRQVLCDQVAFDPASRRPGGQDGIGVFVEWRESRAAILELRPDIFDDLPDQSPRNEDRNEESIHRSTASPSGANAAKEPNDDTLLVSCLYLRKRPGRPRGDCLMFCEGKMLWEGENDVYPTEDELKLGELMPPFHWPLFAFLGDSRKGCPWGRSRIVDAIPSQHALNGCVSKAMQHLAVIANVKYVLPAGLDFEPTDEPGQVARVSQRFWQMTGGKPVQLTQVPQMTPEYLATANWHIARMQGITGINSASQGQPESPDQSGRALESLQERDDSRIAPLKRSHDNRWAMMQGYALFLIRRHATGERQLLIVGEDQSVALRHFKVAHLAAGTQVYAINDTSLSRDPQRRMVQLTQVMTMLAQAKTEEQKRMALELLHVPEIADFLQRASPHQVKAVNVTRLLLLGEGNGTTWSGPPELAPPPNTPIPAPWDNALIHIAEYERFGCSQSYLDRVKAEKEAHENQGVSVLEQKLVWLWTYFQQQLQAARPAAPMPGAAPAPGQPAPEAPPMAMAA